MKKKVVSGLLALGVFITPITSAEVKYSSVINPGVGVGVTNDGQTLFLSESKGMFFSDFDKGYLDYLSESEIRSVLIEELGETAVEEVLSDFPNPPQSFQGFYEGITQAEFHQVLEAMIEKSVIENDIDIEVLGIKGQSLEDRFQPLSLIGDRLIIVDKPGDGDGVVTMYSCDVRAWDKESSILSNLGSCIDTPYYYNGKNETIEFLADALNHVNDAGISAYRKSNQTTALSILDPENGIFEFELDGVEINNTTNQVVLGSGKEPFILFGEDQYTSAGQSHKYEFLYQYSSGTVKKYRPTYGEGPLSIPGNIVNVIGDKLFYANVSEGLDIGYCDINIKDNSLYSFEDFILEKALEFKMQGEGEQGELAYKLLVSYPETPDNIEDLVSKIGISEELIVDDNVDENYKNFVTSFFSEQYQNLDRDVNEVGCVANTTESLYSGKKGLINFGTDSAGNVYVTLRESSPMIPYNTVTISVSDRKVYTHMYEIFKSYQKNYPGLINNAFQRIEEIHPGLLENFPDIPTDLSRHSNFSGLDEKNYLTFASGMILNTAQVKASLENSVIGFSVTSSKVVTGFGVVDYNYSTGDEVAVVAKPASDIIDPYTNPVSSIDIVTNGGLFAADVSCTVAGPMDITSADYGNWGGSERLTLPLQWTSKDAKGIVSLKGDVDSVSGEQQLLVLDTLAEVTTADITVNCAATVSDKNGNQLNVNLIPATIRLDDGIHGGSGVITGQVTLPAGVNSEDVTVEVTINGRTIRLNVDENGRFEFDELRDGDFTINVKSEHYTQSCINTQTTGSQIDLGNIELIAGDVNNDGEINIADFTYLAGRYGSAKGGDRYTTQADLNSDEKVNIQDLAILGSHFGSRQCNP